MLTTNTYKRVRNGYNKQDTGIYEEKAENFPNGYYRKLENNWLISSWWYLNSISWFNLWIDIIFITLKMNLFMSLLKWFKLKEQWACKTLCLCMLWVHMCVCIEIENWIFIFKVCLIKLKQLTKYTILSQFSCS